MSISKFEEIISSTISTLEAISRTDPKKITSCKSGEKFEELVVEVVKVVVTRLHIDVSVHYTPGSHAFPDIVIEFPDKSKYGIEVKSSNSKSKSWKINGNSILGSTRIEDVKDVYIIFGKTSKDYLEFRARRYEDCISNVVVTHSPRYFIDLDLRDGENFFEKSQITYKNLLASDDPIKLITSYFRDQGQKAWWLAESTPAAVKLFSDLSENEKNDVFGYGVVYFPELFGNSNKKYKRLALWLVTEKSIVASSLRDEFSAGGKVDLTINGKEYKQVPQLFNKLYNNKEQVYLILDQTSAKDLVEIWEIDEELKNKTKKKLKAWISLIAELSKNTYTRPTSLLNDIFREYL